MIGGLDFSRGVILEGELRKKRANKVMKWRRKYYILSRTYAALFFWTGTRDRVGASHLVSRAARLQRRQLHGWNAGGVAAAAGGVGRAGLYFTSAALLKASCAPPTAHQTWSAPPPMPRPAAAAVFAGVDKPAVSRM
jgi:hypothetical protein